MVTPRQYTCNMDTEKFNPKLNSAYNMYVSM